MTQPIVLTACLVALAGCGPPSWLTTQAQRVEAPSESGHYWVTGTLGFVAEGTGTSLRRIDAPRPSDDPGYALEHGGRVVEISGRTYLFTHGGGILRKGGPGWEELDVRVPPESDFWDAAQVDDVFLVPDGRVLIRSMQRILLGTANDIERGAFEIAELPRYYDWFGTFDGKLVGTSYDGDRRAVFAYQRGEIADAASWEVVARLPSNVADPYAVVPLAQGGYGFVTSHGINVATADGVETRFLTLDDLVSIKVKREPPKPRAVTKSPLVIATGELLVPPTDGAPAAPVDPRPVVASGERPSALSVALGKNVPSAEGERTDGVTIEGAQLLTSGRVAIWPYQDSGTIPGVAVVGRDGARYFACDLLSVRRVAGVIEVKDRLWVVTTEASVLEMDGQGRCTEPQVPLAPVDED